MLNKRRGWKTVLGTSLAAMILATSLGYAVTAGTKKMQAAWYGTIKIVYNGQDRTAEFDPFIVDGTTYVPLRTMSNIFNKNVDWNEFTKTATVTDTATENMEYWRNQVIIKDIEIGQLERKIEDLEKEVEDTSSKSLRDIERDLNRKYDRYGRIDFEISLKGDERNVDVRIDVDLDRDRSGWDSLSRRDRTNYVEDICKDILKEYPKANIDGYIRDNYDRRDLLIFYTTSRGDVIIDNEYRYDDDRNLSLKKLEEKLDEKYHNEFNTVPLEIKLEGDSKYVTFIVNFEDDFFGKEWRRLLDSRVKTLMSKIYDDIRKEWRNAGIEGYVYAVDEKIEVANYYKTSSGSERFNRFY